MSKPAEPRNDLDDDHDQDDLPTGGLAAPMHPALDPTKKTNETSDPTADDPGNGAD